jgi:hypothetical protein
MQRVIRVTWLLFVLHCAAPWVPAAEPNALLKQLLDQGVDVGGGRRIRLPPPTLSDGLSGAEQQQALAKITDENHPLAGLVRKAVVAPFVLKISDEKAADGSFPRRVDLWFVAYGDLQAMTDETFLKQQVDQQADAGGQGDERGGAGRSTILTDDELRARGIPIDAAERYLAADFKLFDRVQLSGVMRARLARAPESVTLAAALDPRFAEDAKYPNGWRSLHRDDAGKLVVGERQPYSAAGWYAKATRLTEPVGAILVEYHLVFDEPAGWFNGANLLRSKLPILAQDGVRSFRRKLADPAK